MMNKREHILSERTFGNHYFLVAVTASLILVLIGVLSQRLDRELDRVQQVHFEFRLAELQAAVRVMQAALVSQGDLGLASKFEGANPMDWLEEKTAHYVGEMTPESALAHPGKWFFIPETKEIAYVPVDINDDSSENNQMKINNKILRFKVLALRSKEDNEKINGLALIPMND